MVGSMKILLLLATAIFSSLASDEMCTASPSDSPAKTWETFADHNCTNITGYDGFRIALIGDIGDNMKDHFRKWIQLLYSVVDVDILLENTDVEVNFNMLTSIQINSFIIKNTAIKMIRFAPNADAFFKKELTFINGTTENLHLPIKFKANIMTLRDYNQLRVLGPPTSLDQVEIYVKTLDISNNHWLYNFYIENNNIKIGFNHLIMEGNPKFFNHPFFLIRINQLNEDFTLAEEDKLPLYTLNCNPRLQLDNFLDEIDHHLDNKSVIGRWQECCHFTPLSDWNFLDGCEGVYNGNLIIQDYPLATYQPPVLHQCNITQVNGNVFVGKLREDYMPPCMHSAIYNGDFVTTDCNLNINELNILGKFYKPHCNGTYDEEPPVITVKPIERDYTLSPGENEITHKPPIAEDKTTVSTGEVPAVGETTPDGGNTTDGGAGGGSPSSPDGNGGGSPNEESPLGASLYGSNSSSSKTQTKKEDDNSGTIVTIAVIVLLVIILGGVAAVIFYVAWKKKGKAGGDKKKKSKDSNKTEQSKMPAKSEVSVAKKDNADVSTTEKGASEAEKGAPETPATPSSAGNSLQSEARQ